ncbi:MAG: hypothetical protein K1X85_01825 [Ignavibacteria bacterium]|nr:hypothetical protein [Ignavibacteria bacterium]
MRTSLIKLTLFIVIPAILLAFTPELRAQNNSLRSFGNGANDIDRVKIRLDAPAKPVDVSGSFTLEFFMKANAAAFIYLSGNFPEVLNGNNTVDATDIAIADNNASSFISRIIP